MSNDKQPNVSKEELIKEIAKEAKVTQTVAYAVYDATFNQLGNFLAQGRGHTIMGFMNLKTEIKEAHESVNPMTREKIMVPAKRRVFVTVSESLKERVNQK